MQECCMASYIMVASWDASCIIGTLAYLLLGLLSSLKHLGSIPNTYKPLSKDL